MQSSLLTNILLSLIAVLLLVQVIQNGMSDSGSSSPAYSRPTPHSRNPSVAPNAPMMGHQMFEQALSGFPAGCDKSKKLADCDSPAAKAIRDEINQLVQAGSGPRQVFDHIVNKYGIEALTPEAQKIRGMRVSP